MTMTLRVCSMILVSVSLLLGCDDASFASSDLGQSSSKALNTQPAGEKMNTTDTQPENISGIITYQELEGGFYSLIATDGQKYTFSNLPEEYKVDGLHVRVTAIPQHNAYTITQFGTLLNLIEIEIIPEN